jgi:hypothetical protein
LEHATISVLNQRHPKAQVMGLSGPRGFTLLTNLTAEEVYPAVQNALDRVRKGQKGLCIHPNCGSNMLAAATLTTAATLLGMGGMKAKRRERLERLPNAILLNVLALLVARPLGEWVQANLTVDPSLEQVEVTSIVCDEQGGLNRIRVDTRQG